jgi:LCP family protein required for cell wall assembly
MQYVDLGRLPAVKKPSKKKKFFKLTFVVLLLSVVIYTGYILYWPTVTILKQIAKQPRSVLSLIQNPSGELKKTDGHTNILLIGIDKRSNVPYSYRVNGKEVKKNGFLTDTILIASLDSKTKQVSMVSIPRDLYVKVPSFGKIKEHYTKINAVYSIGNTNDYSTGGVGLLSKKVEEIVGLPIHYSVRIDFDGFRKGVDVLGGLEILVEKSFDDYSYPREGKEDAVCSDGTFNCQVEHLHFDQGLTRMNGDTALKFVRSRKGTNGEGSDFARAKRQQKVLIAAKDKALDLGNLADPNKLNNLFKEFGQSVETDLDVSAIVALYNFSKETKSDSIKSLVLDNSENNFLYTPPESQYGAYVLLPKGGTWTKIHEAVDNLLQSKTAENDSL